MNATVILGMLCVHLMCFCVMFLLISIRLKDRKMGTDVFAAGHLLLGLAYFLQLLGGAPGWGGDERRQPYADVLCSGHVCAGRDPVF